MCTNRLIYALMCVLSLIMMTFGQTRIACVGNSITSGVGSGGGGYPGRLQGLLGTGYEVHNEGVSGATMLKKGVLPYWGTNGIPDIFALKPNIITIKLGTNDANRYNIGIWASYPGEYKRDYLALIDTFLTIVPPPQQIWLVIPTPNHDVGGSEQMIVDSVIPVIQSISALRHLPIIDCQTPLLNHPELFPDGVHPNNAGADSIAAIFARALLQGTETAISSAGKSCMSMQTGVHMRRVGQAWSVVAADGETWNLDVFTQTGRRVLGLSGRGNADISGIGSVADKGFLFARLKNSGGSFTTDRLWR